MQEVRYHCDVCGATCHKGHSVIRLEAGPLSRRFPDPLHVCTDACQDRVAELFMRVRQIVRDDLGATSTPAMVDSAGRVA